MPLLKPASSLVINLRRTNLVHMAYSKAHHGGCPNQWSYRVDGHGPQLSPGYVGGFPLELMLDCIWHYGIGDQEFASTSALLAAQQSGKGPLFVLYEDVLDNPNLVKQNAAMALGLPGSLAGGQGALLCRAGWASHARSPVVSPGPHFPGGAACCPRPWGATDLAPEQRACGPRTIRRAHVP